MKRIRPLAVLIAACLFMLCSCGNQQAGVPAPSPSPTPKPAANAATLSAADWWTLNEGFQKFPRYTYGGKAAQGFEDGAILKEDGAYQYLLKEVRYGDYKSYVEHIITSGLPLHDPYGGFVEQAEIDMSAIYGSAVFENMGSRLYIEYNTHSQKLRMEVLSDSML